MSERQKGVLEEVEKAKARGEDDPETYDNLIEMLEAKIKSYPEDVKKNYALYEYFCENVVQHLLIQKWIRNSGKFTVPPIKFGGTGT
jgi:hypothetical protein